MDTKSEYSLNNYYIGGYLELELRKNYFYHPENYKFYNSARSALISLLENRKPERMWLPHFLCQTVYHAIRHLPIDYKFYHLDDEFKVSTNISLMPDDCLFYVDYFGLNSRGVMDVLKKYPKDQIILDFSHSFFSKYSEYNTLGAIYSPRKFFGLPDGGLLCTSFEFSTNSLEVDTSSINRMHHLIKRILFTPEEGFNDYQAAELSLCDTPVLQMSRLTKKILYSLDFKSIQSQRIDNFNHLLATFGSQDTFLLNSIKTVSPLCFPLFVKNKDLREILRSHNIFLPCYWPECREKVSTPWAKKYIQNLLPLPIDQRYNIDDMNHMIGIITKFID